MRRSPAPNDFKGWVAQLAVASCRARAKQHLVAVGPPALPAIRHGLQHENPTVRRLCVNLLDRVLDEEAIPALIAALDDVAPEVSARALHALACDRCKQNECRPAEDVWVSRALRLLPDPNPDLRAAAMDALGRVALRRPEVAAALRVASDTDPDRGLRSKALQHVRPG